MKILPDVGLAMHPMRLRSVVLPDPLGPLSTVISLSPRERVASCKAINSLALPVLNDFLTLTRRITYDLITVSGSTMALLHDGNMVATV